MSTIPRYLIPSPAPQALFADQSTPRAWAARAWILRLSADALERLWQRDQGRLTDGGTPNECPYVFACLPAGMLNGMALECLAKGIIASRTSQDEFRNIVLDLRHRLVPLFERAGVTLSDEERELAERLTTLIGWMGRYPAALKPEGMRVGIPIRIEDLPLIFTLYERVAALVPHDTPTDGGT